MGIILKALFFIQVPSFLHQSCLTGLRDTYLPSGRILSPSLSFSPSFHLFYSGPASASCHWASELQRSQAFHLDRKLHHWLLWFSGSYSYFSSIILCFLWLPSRFSVCLCFSNLNMINMLRYIYIIVHQWTLDCFHIIT